MSADGSGGSARPGSGTTAGEGDPPANSASGRLRQRGLLVGPAGLAGSYIPAMPSSKLSWVRHIAHMPCAKCG